LPASSASDRVRATLAHRVLDRRALLVARIRRRLSMLGAASIDTDDVFSTTLRRLDALAAASRLLDGIPDDQLLALATAVAINATRERARAAKRGTATMRAAAQDSVADAGSDALEDLAEGEYANLLRRQGESLLAALAPADLEILGLRLRGADWAAIAGEVRLTPSAAHRRYFRAIRTLAEIARTGSNGSEEARNTAPPAAGIERPVP
jgi:hypothetical protein